MKPLKIIKTINTVTRIKLEITRWDLLNMVRKAGHVIPDDALVEFYVPGGGDWSNTAIDIDESNPISISWRESS